MIQVTLANNCRSSFGGGHGEHCTSPYLFSPPSRVNPSKAGQHMGLLDRMHFRQGGQNRIIRNMRGGGSASRGKLPKHILQCKHTTPEVSKMQTNKQNRKRRRHKKFQTACFKHMILLWEMIFNDMTLDAANWNRIRKCLYLRTS